MAVNILFSPKENWDISRLDPPYGGLSPRSANSRELTASLVTAKVAIPAAINSLSSSIFLNAYVIEAVLLHANKLPNVKASLLSVSDQNASNVVWYVSELDQDDGSVILADYQINLDTGAASLNGSKVSAGAQTFSALPGISSGPVKNAPFNLLPLMLVLIQTARDVCSDFDVLFQKAVANAAKQEAGKPISVSDHDHLFRLSHAFYRIIQQGMLKVDIPGGNVNPLPKSVITNGLYADAAVVLGDAPFLMGKKTGITRKKALTYGNVKEEFEKWAKRRKWTAEEEMLIPQFPDNYPVSPEALKIARRFVQSQGGKNPMVNFLWRGITAYGKSTGVKLIAALLHMPLVRITCNSTMETQNFLSEFVPDNGEAMNGPTPTVEQMYLDPEGSYETLTGIHKEDANPDDCLQALIQRAAHSSGTPRFKLVESNYVKALSRGWIVEVQEMSRVRDPGVLVGLNEYNEPNAVIPLANGGYVRRHPDALCIYTDNVGYVSCRPVDPSVIRRMALIIDSYEMPEKTVLARVKYNTGIKDKNLLKVMYDTWKKLSDYCKAHDISDGSLSVTELENWALCVKLDDGENIYDSCVDCVVSKITNDIETQKELKAAVLDVCLHMAA